jgi:hypothetical protein
MLACAAPCAIAQEPNENQIIVFEHFDYKGASKTYTLEGQKNMDSFNELGDFHDIISSAKIGKGIKATFYHKKGLNSWKLNLYRGSYKSFRDWDNSVASLKLEKVDPTLPLAKLHYSNGDFQTLAVTGEGEYVEDPNFLVTDGAISIDVPAEYTVKLYQHPNYEGWTHSNPLEEGTHTMSSVGLEKNLSSLKLAWKDYTLKSMKLGNGELQKEYPEEALAGTIDAVNDSSAVTTSEQELKSTYESSYTTSWENETTAGLTISNTVSAEVEGPGVKASMERSIALEIANSFSFGKSETSTQGQEVTVKGGVTLQPGQAVKLQIVTFPVEEKFDVTYTYSPDNGNGPDKIIKGSIFVKKASRSSIRATDIGKMEGVKNMALESDLKAKVIASGATWEGNWSWANDDSLPANHSKLIIKSETEFVYMYDRQNHTLHGKIGYAGGNPNAPLSVDLSLPNGDQLCFVWKSIDEVEGQFWHSGQRDPQGNNKPRTTSKLIRADSK